MIKKVSFNLPVVFEWLIWIFYVGLYKYSYYVEQSQIHAGVPGNFPYPIFCVYGICTTLYLIPYYRWLVPGLLLAKRYLLLIGITVIFFIFLTSWYHFAVAWIFEKFTVDMAGHHFFYNRSLGFFIDWNMMLTDAIAFLCVAFSRFSFQNEQKRHQIETDHLKLQLSMLKNQLQPHFLFNTLNSLYGMSLSGSKDTSRFILMLSQMMQYILYDADKELIGLEAEVSFMQSYFELEQKKYPDAAIILKVQEELPDLNIPPLLFLPLVENSFKHGRHKLENKAVILAEFSVNTQELTFKISNDMLPELPAGGQKGPGGIGLINIKKRLELYYPGRHTLLVTAADQVFKAELKIRL